MKISHVVTAVLMLGVLSACTLPKSDLKSPCAGAEGSPCGPRVPVNDWWLKNSEHS